MKAPIYLHEEMCAQNLDSIKVAVRKQAEIAVGVAETTNMVRYETFEEKQDDIMALESKIFLLLIKKLTTEVMIRQ